MFSFLLVILCFSFLIQSALTAKCSVKSDDISARWQVVDGELTVEVVTNNIGNNEWSAVGFGADMSNMNVVVFQIVDFKPSVVTGITQGYAAPILDSTPSVTLQSLNYNSNTLTIRFARPIGSLSSCSTWNFVTEGAIEDGSIGYHNAAPHSVEICADKCTNNIFN